MLLRHHIRNTFLLLFIVAIGSSCDKVPVEKQGYDLTIFFVNDMHGKLDDFAKIKHIVDAEESINPVLLVSAGDIFSGNAIVDQYPQKGYPIIDIMNKTGFDISVIGNHEFDYGLAILKDRMQQASFDWVCANVNVESSVLPQPDPFVTLQVGDLDITLLGFVETFGKPDDVIPATHPWRVADVSFQHFYDIAGQYSDLKQQEGADILMALTHMGTYSDTWLANNHPYFDLIIGGHSNDLNDSEVNGIPVLMAGTRLSHLGRIRLKVKDKAISNYEVDLIDLSGYSEKDEDLMADIEVYSNNPDFETVIGTANSHHDRTELGCFYTTALMEYMDVDVSFQNPGGIRTELDEGDVTKLEIYNIDPFNNGSVVFTFTVEELKTFFMETEIGLHVTGINLVQNGTDLFIYDLTGEELANDHVLTIGINDYIPAVNDLYFDINDADIREMTTAESLIDYLSTMNSTVDFEGCNHYFRYVN